MPSDHAKRGAIWQYGEESSCTLLVNDCPLSWVLQTQSCDVHEGDSDALLQLRDTIGDHAQ